MAVGYADVPAAKHSVQLLGNVACYLQSNMHLPSMQYAWHSRGLGNTVAVIINHALSSGSNQPKQQSKADLGVEVGGGEAATHSHPPWPNVVVLPKQFQPPHAYRTEKQLPRAGVCDMCAAYVI